LAYLRGDRAAAIAQFRSSAAQHAENGAQDEAARERWALGCVLGEAEGQQLRAAALVALAALGIREPAEELRGYYPELLPATAKSAAELLRQ
jgi:hypothetical protein